MSVLFRNVRVFDTARRDFIPGEVWVNEDHIAKVSWNKEIPTTEYRDAEILDGCGMYLIPGLVDVHTHGRAGGDFATADEAMLCRMAESYLASGVTTLLPTLASAPLGDLYAAARRIETVRVQNQHNPACARFAGLHLEGRYLNPAKRGAHAPHLLYPLDADEALGILSQCGGVKHISAAIELDGGAEFLRALRAHGVTVGMGHTAATYAQAMAAIEGGVASMTHLFNAMPPLHHRDGGAVCAGLVTSHVYCELICDGFHIAPEMVKLACRMKGDHLTLITDSMEATDCADGEYAIAGMPVVVKDGKARTIDGAIAGSTLSLWEAVLNLVSFAEIPLGEAVYAATMAPALQVGLAHEIGSIEEGKRADLLLVDDNHRLSRVMHDGVFCTPRK
ncbi:MAG: N-acetylglucosamine-6-phosphate deacetylase [Ruminococcaceae bacterium]|nr:N-acetylglucosamine-6-phosphate deacetylase [Oscillospiraceae bacterium]